MKKTLREKLKFKFQNFGKKNIFCRLISRPVYGLCMGVISLVEYSMGNVKRFSMLALSFFIFAVYSSYFLTFFAKNGAMGQMVIDEASESIGFAKEQDLSEEDFVPVDEDSIDGYYYSEDSGIYEIAGEVYDVDEILKSYNWQNKAEPSGEETHTQPEVDLHMETEPDKKFSKDDWKIILVNKTHYIPEDYTFTLGTISGNFKCDERILDDLLKMFQAARDDGINLLVASPYRTHDRQENNFNRSINNYMARGMSYMEAYKLTSQVITIPDTSEHQIGLAIDIWTDTFKSLTAGFGDTAAGKWLAQNSYKYGFILRYPKGKEDITCIEYEPWHFRYVGYEAAKIMFEENITLEEFWEEYVE